MKNLSVKLYLMIVVAFTSLGLYFKNSAQAEDGAALIEWVGIAAVISLALAWIFLMKPIDLLSKLQDLGQTSSTNIQNLNEAKPK